MLQIAIAGIRQGCHSLVDTHELALGVSRDRLLAGYGCLFCSASIHEYRGGKSRRLSELSVYHLQSPSDGFIFLNN